MAVLRPGHDVRDFGGRRDQVQDGSRWRRSPRTARSSSCGASRGRYSVHEPSQFLTADTGLTATTSGSSRAVAALAEPLDDRGGAGAEQRSCCRGCNGHCRILDGKFIRHQGCCSCAAGTQQSCRGATGDPRSPLERAVRIRAVEGHGDSLLVARAGCGARSPVALGGYEPGPGQAHENGNTPGADRSVLHPPLVRIRGKVPQSSDGRHVASGTDGTTPLPQVATHGTVRVGGWRRYLRTPARPCPFVCFKCAVGGCS